MLAAWGGSISAARRGTDDENDRPALGFQGLTFRTLSIERREWSICRVNSDADVLQEPVFGRIADGVGRSYGVDVDNGRPVRGSISGRTSPPPPLIGRKPSPTTQGEAWR